MMQDLLFLLGFGGVVVAFLFYTGPWLLETFDAMMGIDEEMK